MKIKNTRAIEDFFVKPEARRLVKEIAKENPKLAGKLIEKISNEEIQELSQIEDFIREEQKKEIWKEKIYNSLNFIYSTALIFSLFSFKPSLLYNPEINKEQLKKCLIEIYKQNKIEFEDYLEYYRITSRFGEKRGYGRKTKIHEGIDLAANNKKDKYIKAFMDGIVVYRAYGWNGGWGNFIVTRHEFPSKALEGIIKTDKESIYIYLLYAHLGKIYKKTGEGIKRGDVLAYMWKSGRAKGVHTHIEARISDEKVNNLNKILKQGPQNFEEIIRKIKEYDESLEILYPKF